MALDTATTQFIAQLAAAGGPPIHEQSPAEARAKLAGLTALFGAGPAMARAESFDIPGPDHRIPVRLLSPSDHPAGVIVYYHGGGWVLGALPEYEVLGRQLADQSGCAVVLIDYRLAPEHPYPAAVDDAWAALCWVGENMDTIAGTRVPLIAVGDSAGGNLATIVSRKARDAGGPSVALQVLVYPVTDCDLDNGSYTDPTNQTMLNRETMIWFWDHYVAPSARMHPDVSPARAEVLAGLPPAVVLTAEHDVLRDEGEAYASALQDAGVPVTHRRFAGQMHGFFTMVNLLPGSAAGIDFVTQEVRMQLGSQAPRGDDPRGDDPMCDDPIGEGDR